MALLDKLTDAAATFGDKASDAIETTKLKSKINSEKKAIELELARIGRIYYEKMKSGVMEEVKRLFKPEFLNRIDETIVFHQLTKDDMKRIINLLAQSLITRCRTQLDISLTLTPSLKEHIVEKYSNLKMGARPLKRAIQTLIEDALAEEILSGRVKSGDHVSAGFRENKVVFSVKNK